MIRKIIDCSVILLFLTIALPLISFAQNLGSTTNFLELSLSPKNPEPFQAVTVTLNSYSYDLDRSKISWSVDGVTKKTEIGLREFTTTAGKNGQKTIIKTRVETPNDGVKEIEAFFIPSVVDLIYESLSYTPPFYKGRALNPNQGVFIVTAIPELIKTTGEKVPAQNIIYAWKKDGQVMQSDSGIGKNTFLVSGTVPIRDVRIEVSASSLDGDIFASKQVLVTNTQPRIIFYENNPVYGLMMNKAITKAVNMLTDEFSVLAVPYFFSVGYATTPDLKYDWTMNGATVGNQEPKNAFTARINKTGSGTADIGLKISNLVRIFQFTNNSYQINFSKQ